MEVRHPRNLHAAPGPKASRFPSSPKVWGPGVWFVIHSEARNATSETELQAYAALVRRVVASLLCEECSGDGSAYIEKNPPERYKGVDAEGISNVFRWSWFFHNHVNQKLGKQLFDWDDAIEAFSPGASVCPSGCGEEKPDASHTPPLEYSPYSVNLPSRSEPWQHIGVAPITPSHGVTFGSPYGRDRSWDRGWGWY